MSYTADFLDFIAASPSSYHAADEVSRQLSAAGFEVQDEGTQWSAAPGGHVMVRGGAVAAWYVPEGADKNSGFRIVGSHTDSPGLVLKPTPDFSAAGWQQVAVEVYGGALLHTWFDRELTVAGQIVTKDGTRHLVNTGPVLRLPSLAIHLYRKDEFKPDRQHNMQPVLSVGDPEASILQVVGEKVGVAKQDIASFNLITADAARGEVFGAGEQFIAAGRMDNLSSVHASLAAMKKAAEEYQGKDILVMMAFDHEEVGSSSRYGAGGPILADVLTRTARALGVNEEERFQMFSRSSCVSADAAHSVHPNYVGKHDPTHHPIVGKGPVTKINGNQRYASDATTVALWEAACEKAGVPVQRFVGNNDVPCGSTIGPITATRLGIDTVDVGVPMLSMHSAREMVGERDQVWLAQALEAYLVG
ncbi:M18 family aminopeptidase [Corynebacterium tuberculostearicum]|uniref:M18 family aminopeptidase n=1 Tax=Corynebacterium tuberculostearicum TaxID=38304 RepID=UPI0020269703|nr:M18 family aminopeptidase [Corynebacterium tuberculostearicum]MCG7454818.1 M18 family aminopeptidase [Corynebacterium tuberculostearicum]MDV2420602.1 M18 family aminopeptidase [Corynebacterium tuberculostearicum]